MDSQIDILDSGEYNSFQNYLQERSNMGIKWNKIYVSFGGKWNNLTVPLKTFNDQMWISNSLDQMIPSFIRYQTEINNTLVIIIDEFKDTKIMNLNKKLITHNIEDSNNVYVCIINKFCNSKEIIMDFTSKVIEFSTRHNIINKNFMICNFVKYLNQPNIFELSNSISISSAIDDVIKDTVYRDCLYEWFGYKYGLHTLVYNRNKLYKQPYFGYSARILKNILKHEEFNLPIHMWKEITTKNLHVLEILKHVCSLEAYHEDSFCLNTPLYDIIKHNKINQEAVNYMENVDY